MQMTFLFSLIVNEIREEAVEQVSEAAQNP
jgi:hypothetical protein